MIDKRVHKHLKNSKKAHTLYLVALQHPITKEIFCKVGITAYSIQMRFIDCDYEIKYSKEYPFSNGIEARGWESLLLEKIIPYDWHYYPKLKSFAGKTECYELTKIRQIESLMDDVLIPKKRGRKSKKNKTSIVLKSIPSYKSMVIDYGIAIEYIDNNDEYDCVPELTEKLILWGDEWEI
ncbi:hypothetical protein E0W68_02250 [Flavobacterium salilacus subsp. salilacus]|uniref:hypothetical protein n=1 Tax=Flavobacterium TaxID=237 RepID=UPI0010754120|nr:MULTISPECIES: hypothetical protein [Flavobacterium]KAF2520064.1 hypothetical protein E0W68_02250 [Flavobacterium salilacus subsp. salilacus]MBE1614020.1 hypothetical protein [Flavobacterium sp. SaA2.13]